MKLRGISHPSNFAGGVFCSFVAFLLLFCVLNVQPAFAQAAPILRGVSPPQAHLGEQLDLLLDGEGFTQLDNLTGINISGVPVSYSHYEIIDDQTIMVSLQIPEQSPTGDQRITFIFDNEYRLEAPFAVLEPAGPAQEAPYLNAVSPQQGRPGDQLSITLDGGGFSRLVGLQAVKISGVDAPLLGYNLDSDQSIQVVVRIPQKAPPGEGDIAFFFENDNLDASFVVLQQGSPPPEVAASPVIQGISPQEGRVGSDLSLNLSGENLSRLGNLQSVDINGIDIPVVSYQVLSDQTVEIQLTIPADITAGAGQISFSFDNSSFGAPFSLLAVPQSPRPPIDVIILVVLVAGGIGFIGLRLIRRPKPQTKTASQKPAPTSPQFDFKTHLDPGSQTIEANGPSIKADIDIRLVAKIDYGVPYIETERGSLTAE